MPRFFVNPFPPFASANRLDSHASSSRANSSMLTFRRGWKSKHGTAASGFASQILLRSSAYASQPRNLQLMMLMNRCESACLALLPARKLAARHCRQLLFSLNPWGMAHTLKRRLCGCLEQSFISGKRYILQQLLHQLSLSLGILQQLDFLKTFLSFLRSRSSLHRFPLGL